MEAEELLSTTFTELGLDESFCNSAAAMGFKKLNDIVFLLPEKLIRKKGFSYAWLGELSKFLESQGMLYLLQPLPGKNCG